MSSQSYPVKLTYQDYLLLPDDGKRHELIDGDHYMTPSPNIKHQTVSSNLHRIISAFVHGKQLGRLFAAPTDVVLSEFDVIQPDLFFISSSRTSIIAEQHIQGAPDLVIEVLSDKTRKTDEMIKRRLYERHGVKEYWIVDPELETIKIYRATDRGYTRAAELTTEMNDVVTTPLLPGLSMALADIFAEIR